MLGYWNFIEILLYFFLQKMFFNVLTCELAKNILVFIKKELVTGTKPKFENV
jgi:hypothetical protein